MGTLISSQETHACMHTGAIYLLHLLHHAKSAGISGRVRLQKVVYILKEGLAVPFETKFNRKKYGPFSEDLMDIIAKLKFEGLIEEERVGAQYVYKITKDGKRFYEENVIDKLDPTLTKRIDSVADELMKTRVDYLTGLAYALEEVMK